MRLFILINFQNKDKELILVDNREKAKKTRVIRVITRSYGRSNNGKEQDTSESNLTTTQMKKEAQDHLDLEILISNDVNNIIEKRTNKEHSDSSNISPTSASSLTTNPMRKIINNFRTSIINLSLFEKFQLGYLLFIIIFFILPIVLFKMGNINLFFDIVSAMETAKAVQSAEELFTIKLTTTPVYKWVDLPVNDLVAQAKAFRNSGLFEILKRDPNEFGRLFGTKEGQDMIFKKIHEFAKHWKVVAGPINNNDQLISTLYTDTIIYVVSICDEAKLSKQKTINVMNIFYSFLVEEEGKTALELQGFRSSNIFFGYVVDQTNGELVDDFLKRERAKYTVTTTTTTNTAATTATPATTEIYNEFLERVKRLKAQSTATTTPTTTTTTTAPVPLTTAISLHEDPHTNAFLVWYHTTPPSLRPIVNSWFGWFLRWDDMYPTTTTTATTTQAIVSNIDTSSTSSTSANTSNGNEPRRSLLVGRRSPEPLSDHTKKNFGGIGEHYNNFRNSPYFYHITIGTLISTVAIGIVIYKYMN